MGQRITQVDAFTNRTFAGNPAAVCILSESADDRWLAAVAREMNLSETAYLWRLEDGYRLRWFTPTVEVDLCGHATLASSHVLWEEGHLSPGESARFHTRSGLLTARCDDHVDGRWIELDFPTLPAVAATPPTDLLPALGIAARYVYVGKNQSDYLVEVEGEEVVRGLTPDFGRLRGLPVRGVIVTSRAASTEYDFVSRFFAPGSGIDEDPVTGSAHCCLGPFWASRLNKHELVGYQASARGGTVRVRLAGERAYLTGQAITVLRGELV